MPARRKKCFRPGLLGVWKPQSEAEQAREGKVEGLRPVQDFQLVLSTRQAEAANKVACKVSPPPLSLSTHMCRIMKGVWGGKGKAHRDRCLNEFVCCAVVDTLPGPGTGTDTGTSGRGFSYVLENKRIADCHLSGSPSPPSPSLFTLSLDIFVWAATFPSPSSLQFDLCSTFCNLISSQCINQAPDKRRL